MDDPLARGAAGHQQDVVDAGERLADCLGARVVSLAHLDAEVGEIAGLARGTDDGDDV